jgi:lipoprotein-anchoring transpeptidase ErfK/SrfK
MGKFISRFTLLSVMFLVVGALSLPVVHAEGGKAILVSIEQQKLYAFENYLLVHEFDVITGRAGKETETGKFKISRKYKDYTSKKYDAPMPYSMFFSGDGKAIHATGWATLRSYVQTYVSGSLGSHGCVGLTEEDAITLFEWAPVGTNVVIVDVQEEDDEQPDGDPKE